LDISVDTVALFAVTVDTMALLDSNVHEILFVISVDNGDIIGRRLRHDGIIGHSC
jgi:hypothetical protein